MPIRFSCPTCGKKINAPERLQGQESLCPNCNGVVQVPSEEPLPDAPHDEAPARSPRIKVPYREPWFFHCCVVTTSCLAITALFVQLISLLISTVAWLSVSSDRRLPGPHVAAMQGSIFLVFATQVLLLIATFAGGTLILVIVPAARSLHQLASTHQL